MSVAGNPYADLSSILIDVFEFRPGQPSADEWHTTSVRADGTYSIAVPPNEYLLRFRSVRSSSVGVEELFWPNDNTRLTVAPGVVAGPNPVLVQSTGLMGTLTVLPDAADSEDWEAGDYRILAYSQDATSIDDYGNSRSFQVPLEGVSTIQWHIIVEPGKYRIAFVRSRDDARIWYGGGNIATAPLVTVVDGATTQGLHAKWDTTQPLYTPGQPTITGPVQAGQTLTAQANPSTWPEGTAFTYEWFDGSTGATHVVTPRDWQAYAPLIWVAVTGHTPGYAPVTRISPIASGAGTLPPTPQPPSSSEVKSALQKALAAAKVSGAKRVGEILKVRGLTASLPLRAGVTYRFQWTAGAKAIKKATTSQLRLTRALKGKVISVKITAAYASVRTARTLKVGKVA